MNEAARLRSELDGLRRDKDQVGLFINLLHILEKEINLHIF